MPFGKGICLIWGNCYCSTDLMKEIAPVARRELDNCPVQIPYYGPPPTNLGGWGVTVIAALNLPNHWTRSVYHLEKLDSVVYYLGRERDSGADSGIKFHLACMRGCSLMWMKVHADISV